MVPLRLRARRPFLPRARPSRAMMLVGLAAVPVSASGCGSDDGGTSGDRPTLVVQAAASLTGALTSCTKNYAPAKVRLSFAGSDELAAQIRKGAGGDLFAAANATLPQALAKEGKVEKPVAFAGNELVLAVPAKGGKVATLDDVAGDKDVRLAVGAPSVPVGSYTQKALGRLPAAERSAILARVRTEEPDVKSVLAKLQQGVVDAAFVYRTDVQATKGAVRAVALPATIRPKVSYEAAVVKGSGQASAATALLKDLRTGGCQQALRAAGFLAPGAGG